MKKYTVSIHQSCTASLQEMPITENGRFCQSCQKQVVDFTGMTDQQMIAYLSKNKNCCGSLLPSQLDREIAVKSPSSFVPAAILAGMLAIATPESSIGQTRHITGIVKDSVHEQPIPGVAVTLIGTLLSAKCQSDGRFVLPLPDSLKENIQLAFSGLGFELKYIRITETDLNHPIEVELQEREFDPNCLAGVVGGISLQRESWWHKLKRKLFK